MSHLSTPTLIAFALTPLALTLTALGGILWFRFRRSRRPADGPERLLAAAIRHMPADRREWGEAMLAELAAMPTAADRWQFAFGCARAAIFPPPTTSWLRYWLAAFRRLGPVCGLLSVLLPPLSLPLLYLTAIAAGAFMTHDDFSSGELVPTILSAFILLSVAIMFSGIPLGIAGLVRREQFRWLSILGLAWSAGLFAYLQVVQHVAAQLAAR